MDGTQSYVFEFDTPEYRDLGYGFSTTTVHEFGHHIGMSHPHDGYDSGAGRRLRPAGDFYFVWSGDESNTIMHYLDLSTSFGEFDRDNMYRYLAAVYVNQTNALLPAIYKKPGVAKQASLLLAADARAGAALTAYAAMDYAGAAANAKLAYDKVIAAAARLKVPIEPQAWQADYKAKGASPMFVDSVDYQRNKP